MSRYLLLRQPSTQEDAGRQETIGTYATRDEARAEVQRRTSSGYHRASSFILLDTHNTEEI
jgi:hypothetical protein